VGERLINCTNLKTIIIDTSLYQYYFYIIYMFYRDHGKRIFQAGLRFGKIFNGNENFLDI